MQVHELIKLLAKYRPPGKWRTTDHVLFFFRIITDRDDEDPVLDYAEASLQKIYNGSAKISKEKANILSGMRNMDPLAYFIRELSMDQQESMIVELHAFGFLTSFSELPEFVADIANRLLDNLKEGIDNVTPADLHPKDAKGNLVEPFSIDLIYIGDDGFLHTPKNSIDLRDLIFKKMPDKIEEGEWKYLDAMYNAILDKGIKLSPFSPFRNENYNIPRIRSLVESQRRCYHAACVFRETAIRIFPPEIGRKEYRALLEEALRGTETTYYDLDVPDGYTRMRRVQDLLLRLHFASRLAHISGLLTANARQGLAHLLITERLLKTWVLL